MEIKRPATKKLAKEIEQMQKQMETFLRSDHSKQLMGAVVEYSESDKLTKMFLRDFFKARDMFEFTMGKLKSHFDSVEAKKNVTGL